MDTDILQKITELRHTLHAHPELSLQESWTKAALMDFIRKETSLTVIDRGRWFYARYDCGNPAAPRIAFRADFDALPMEEKPGLPYGSVNPGVCHKCGHDGHSSVLCGLAMEIDRYGADKNLTFIFQHAEEIGAGGAECAELLKEEKIDAVYAFHNMSGYPEGSIVLKKDVAQCTSKGLIISMKGIPAHASQPEDGRNPAAALAKLALYAADMDLKTGYSGFVLSTLIELSVGSKNFGIAASEGSVSFTLRADYERDLARLETGIRDQAVALAAEYGLALTFAEQDFFPETVNDDGALETVRLAAEANHYPVIDMEHSFRASEDFGWYLKKCPGAMFYIGNGESYPPIHTADYDFNDRILPIAVGMFAALAGEKPKE